MKKLILIFIALSFFSVCFAGSIQDMHKAAIARKNAAPTTVFDENFDNCDTGTGFGNCDESWGTAGSFTVTAAEGPDASQAVIYAGSTDATYSLNNTLGAGDFTITIDFKIDSGVADIDDLMIYFQDTDGDIGIQVYIRYDDPPTMRVSTYGHTEGFVTICSGESIANWYTITIDDINWTNHTYDIDVSIKDGASQGNNDNCEFLTTDADNIDDIYLKGSTANVVDFRIDNFLITEP